MSKERIVLQYRRRGSNIVMYVEDKFLIVPVSEVDLRRESLVISQENLDAAYDVTPDLSADVLAVAWKFGIVFLKDMKAKWAQDIGAVVPGLSAQDIVNAFRRVRNE